MDAASVARRARGENFPVASLLFPRALRPHLRRIYGYCRLVDILGDEAEADRSALPAEDRRRFGVTRLDVPNDPLRLLLAFESDRASRLLAGGQKLELRLGGRVGRAVGLFARGGLAALEALRRADFDVFAGRPRPSRARLAREAVATLVR